MSISPKCSFNGKGMVRLRGLKDNVRILNFKFRHYRRARRLAEAHLLDCVKQDRQPVEHDKNEIADQGEQRLLETLRLDDPDTMQRENLVGIFEIEIRSGQRAEIGARRKLAEVAEKEQAARGPYGLTPESPISTQRCRLQQECSGNKSLVADIAQQQRDNVVRS